jgi:hypothetical protein
MARNPKVGGDHHLAEQGGQHFSRGGEIVGNVVRVNPGYFLIAGAQASPWVGLRARGARLLAGATIPRIDRESGYHRFRRSRLILHTNGAGALGSRAEPQSLPRAREQK